MSGKEWLRLCLVAVTTSSWWAWSVWPKMLLGGIEQVNPYPGVPAVVGSIILFAMAGKGIYETWDKPQ